MSKERPKRSRLVFPAATPDTGTASAGSAGARPAECIGGPVEQVQARDLRALLKCAQPQAACTHAQAAGDV
jgi:hypothetical protein